MAKQSAGLLVYRRDRGTVEVFLVHPGGPYWRNKDLGAWSISKGEFAADEDPLDAAKREFNEETGLTMEGTFTPLGAIRQRGGKTVQAWLVEANFDASNVKSNSFTLEWPPGSGETQVFPEIDRAEWFTLETAQEKLIEGQRELLDSLRSLVGDNASSQ